PAGRAGRWGRGTSAPSPWPWPNSTTNTICSRSSNRPTTEQAFKQRNTLAFCRALGLLPTEEFEDCLATGHGLLKPHAVVRTLDDDALPPLLRKEPFQLVIDPLVRSRALLAGQQQRRHRDLPNGVSGECGVHVVTRHQRLQLAGIPQQQLAERCR